MGHLSIYILLLISNIGVFMDYMTQDMLMVVGLIICFGIGSYSFIKWL